MARARQLPWIDLYRYSSLVPVTCTPTTGTASQSVSQSRAPRSRGAQLHDTCAMTSLSVRLPSSRPASACYACSWPRVPAAALALNAIGIGIGIAIGMGSGVAAAPKGCHAAIILPQPFASRVIPNHESTCESTCESMHASSLLKVQSREATMAADSGPQLLAMTGSLARALSPCAWASTPAAPTVAGASSARAAGVSSGTCRTATVSAGPDFRI